MVHKTILLILLSVVCLNAQIMLNPDRATTLGGGGGGGSSETGEIFADDFEDNTLDAWVVVDASGNTITVVSDSVNSGSYAGNLYFDSTSAKNIMAFGVNNATEVFFRGYIHIDGDFTSSAAFTVLPLITFMDGGTKVAVARIKVNSSLDPYQWSIREFVHWNSAAAANDAGIYIDNWARVELGWQQGDTDSTGFLELRVNGDSLCAMSDLDYQGYFVDSVKVGSQNESKLYDGNLGIDDVVTDSTSGWVGAKP